MFCGQVCVWVFPTHPYAINSAAAIHWVSSNSFISVTVYLEVGWDPQVEGYPTLLTCPLPASSCFTCASDWLYVRVPKSPILGSITLLEWITELRISLCLLVIRKDITKNTDKYIQIEEKQGCGVEEGEQSFHAVCTCTTLQKLSKPSSFGCLWKLHYICMFDDNTSIGNQLLLQLLFLPLSLGGEAESSNPLILVTGGLSCDQHHPEATRRAKRGSTSPWPS